MAQAILNNREIEMEQEIDRIQTINLEVMNDRIVETDEVLIALQARNFLHKTRCLQQISKNRFRWSLNNKEETQNILQTLNEEPLMVNTDIVKAHYASRMRTFILYDTPFELSREEIRKIFSDFGVVQDVRRTTFRNWPQIHDGRIILTYQNQMTTVPECIKLGKSGRITIREPGQRVRKRRCAKCLEEDHETKDCLGQTICHECGEEGHRKNACPNMTEEKQEAGKHDRLSTGATFQMRNEVILASQTTDLRPEFLRATDKDKTTADHQGAEGEDLITLSPDSNLAKTVEDLRNDKYSDISLEAEEVIDTQFTKLVEEQKRASTPQEKGRKKLWGDRSLSEESEPASPAPKVGKIAPEIEKTIETIEKPSGIQPGTLTKSLTRLGLMSTLFNGSDKMTVDTKTKKTTTTQLPKLNRNRSNSRDRKLQGKKGNK